MLKELCALYNLIMKSVTEPQLQHDLDLEFPDESFIPHIIKYMGSKKPILNFVTSAISEIHHKDRWVCDLFSGSCSISASLRKKYNFISNDIQSYSDILAHTYFSDLSRYSFEELFEQVETSINNHFQWFKEHYRGYFFDFSQIHDLEEYARIELLQRDLFNDEIFGTDFHLFVKYYSGTYWSFEQCAWIDALRKTAEGLRESPVYYAFMASIMYAMSYTTQSTGHFAQYRDGGTTEAMYNIIYYRKKSVYELFKKKFKHLLASLDNSLMELRTSTLSFEACLKAIPESTTVYADPPYAPVHYSRFYHALETLVKYDYPAIDFKGRYRTDRHQSAFSQKGKALKAFEDLYTGIIAKKSQLVLSYSDKGVIEIDKIIAMAEKHFARKYKVEVRTLDHVHSTMGRFEDARRDVFEYLIIASF